MKTQKCGYSWFLSNLSKYWLLSASQKQVITFHKREIERCHEVIKSSKTLSASKNNYKFWIFLDDTQKAHSWGNLPNKQVYGVCLMGAYQILLHEIFIFVIFFAFLIFFVIVTSLYLFQILSYRKFHISVCRNLTCFRLEHVL